MRRYVQDNWKVTPRLTLNLGVRYSYFAQPTDSSGLLSNFLPSTYVAANAPTVDSTGSICTVAPCANVYGINGTAAEPQLRSAERAGVCESGDRPCLTLRR